MDRLKYAPPENKGCKCEFRGTAYWLDITDTTFELYNLISLWHEKTLRKHSEDALLIHFNEASAPDWIKNNLN